MDLKNFWGNILLYLEKVVILQIEYNYDVLQTKNTIGTDREIWRTNVSYQFAKNFILVYTRTG